jgi:threonine dehydratase
MSFPNKESLINAVKKIAQFIHRTPVLTSSSFNQMAGAEVFFKCENFQRMGAFKMRGAAYALTCLSSEQLAKGVVTHSSGNFAQAVALSAKLMGVKAKIVMPENAPRVKIEAVKGYGAEIVFSGPMIHHREEAVEKLVSQEGFTFIHPSNDMDVIIGNSTAAQELIQDIPALDILISPVGGGGILAGTALAAYHFSPKTKVLGAEPKNVDDAFRSMLSGKIESNPSEAFTIADGLRTTLGDINFPVITQLADSIICVSEEEIIEAMWWVWERMKIIIEPSSAVAVAAVLHQKELFEGKSIGLMITGGNADIKALAG